MITFHTASFFEKGKHRGICFSIAFSQPSTCSFPSLNMLKPSPKLLSRFRAKKISEQLYERSYIRETLRKTSPKELIRKILSMCPAHQIQISDVTLLCWEPAGEFCHRRLVMDWLWRHRKGRLTQLKIGEIN